MARAVRFTKPERAAIVLAVQTLLLTDVKKYGKVVQNIKAKIEESEHPAVGKPDCLTVKDAIAAFRSVLDRRLVVPPNGAGLVYIRMQHQLKSLALTREQCIQAAEQAGREWCGNIKAQSILNQAETLLHNAESEPLPMEGRSDYETRTMEDL